MRTTEYEHVVLLFALIVTAVLLSVHMPPCEVRADDTIASGIASTRNPTRNRDRLHLARICVSEAGWDPGSECAAIHEVLVDRARVIGISYRAAACAYSTRTCTRSRQDARRWIAHLTLDGRRPEGWPRGTSWTRHRALWRGVLELAADVIRGRVESPCPSPIHHWGDRHGDRLRALRYGWEQVECGRTRNLFWRVPGRS